MFWGLHLALDTCRVMSSYSDGEKVDMIIAGLVHSEMSLGEIEKHV